MDMNYRLVIEFKDFSDNVKHVAATLSEYALSKKFIVRNSLSFIKTQKDGYFMTWIIMQKIC